MANESPPQFSARMGGDEFDLKKSSIALNGFGNFSQQLNVDIATGSKIWKRIRDEVKYVGYKLPILPKYRYLNRAMTL